VSHLPDDPHPHRSFLAVASLAGAVALAAILGSVWTHKAARPNHDTPPSPLTAAAPTVHTAPEAPATQVAPPPAALAVASAPPLGPPAVAASPLGTAGMLVGIDPETGRPGRPSKAFRDKLAALRAPGLDRSSDGLTVVTRPDGSKHVDLQGRFQEYMVVRLTPDGRKVEDCVEGPDVDKALRSDPAPAPALEEK
jgi:hypothetical protein